MSTQREERKGWSNCFRSQTKTEEWQADFTGVIALESAGHFWVNIFERTDSRGRRYLAINLKPKLSTPPVQAGQGRRGQA